MKQVEAEIPWFGIEQEYTLLNSHTKWPLGWPKGGYPAKQVCGNTCKPAANSANSRRTDHSHLTVRIKQTSKQCVTVTLLDL